MMHWIKEEWKYLQISLAVRKAAQLRLEEFRDEVLEPEKRTSFFPETAVEWRKIS